VELAVAVLFAVPGVPCVYYGDELGWAGVKEHRAGGDEAIRGPLPVDAPAPSPLTDLHRRLIGLRSARPWLTTADVEGGELANQAATCRVAAGDHELWLGIDTRLGEVGIPPGHVELVAGPGYAIAEPAGHR
jgi:cyclomaltodextrinase